MVAERLLRTAINPEAFSFTVIIDAHSLSLPILMAFYAEVVVALSGEGGEA